MPAADTTDAPFYLRGNFAPILHEATAFDLPCAGAIPPELRGLYVRNGPNPKAGDPGHWFAGDGMLHGVRLEGGKAVWFRNRWVRTRAFVDGAELVDDAGNVDHSVAVANTNIIVAYYVDPSGYTAEHFRDAWQRYLQLDLVLSDETDR
jgi:carotenoid cleavage dioxygenase